MEKNQLVNLLNEIFIPLGFKRKENDWISNNDQLLKIINLQKSQYGKYFYINYDFIVKGLELTTKTHVPHRLASSERGEQQLITNLLDLETNISDEDRLSCLKDFILKKVVSVMMSINTEHDLFEYLKKRPHLFDVPLVVKKYFNL